MQSHDFQLSGLLGRGGFGSVYGAVCNRSGAPVAVKVISKEECRKQGAHMIGRVISEVDTHSRIRHANVVDLLVSRIVEGAWA